MGASCAAEQHREELDGSGKRQPGHAEVVPMSPAKSKFGGCCTRPNRALSAEGVGSLEGIVWAVGDDAVQHASVPGPVAAQPMPPSSEPMDAEDALTLMSPPHAARFSPEDDPQYRLMQDTMFSLVGVPTESAPAPRAADPEQATTSGDSSGAAAQVRRRREVDARYDPHGFWQLDEDCLELEEVQDPEVVAAREREDMLESIRDGKPLYTVPLHLRSDKEVVLAAIGNEGAYCLDYIESEELKQRDRDVVFALCLADGTMLKNASPALRADREIVRAALMTSSEALKYASPQLRADEDLKVMAASRAKEESRLMKVFEAKCGPALTSCVPRPRGLLGR